MAGEAGQLRSCRATDLLLQFRAARRWLLVTIEARGMTLSLLHCEAQHAASQQQPSACKSLPCRLSSRALRQESPPALLDLLLVRRKRLERLPAPSERPKKFFFSEVAFHPAGTESDAAGGDPELDARRRASRTSSRGALPPSDVAATSGEAPRALTLPSGGTPPSLAEGLC